MKQLLLFTTILIATQLSTAQNTVTIYGTITNPKGDKVYVQYFEDYVSYNEAVVDSATLDKKGNYRMQFNWEHPGAATFFHGDEITTMFLSPNDNFQLNLDTKEFDETVKYKGKGAEINSYLAQKTLLFPYLDGSEYKLGETAFTRLIDSIQQEKLDYFNEYFAQVSTKDPSIGLFMQTEEAEIIYSWANTKRSYPGLYDYYNKKATPTIVSSTYLDFLKDIPVYNPSAINASSYLEFLSEYVDGEVYKILEKDSALTFFPVKEHFIETNLTGDLKEYIMASWIYDMLIDGSDVENGGRLLTQLKSYKPDSKYIKMLDQTLVIATKLQPGKPAPVFTFPDVNGKLVSLEDFKGKVVYLDIWASWCGPCRMEIPHAKKLEEEMKGQDVVFLAVSIDDDEKAWKKIIADKQLGGIHLLSAGSFESGIAEMYNVNGIPRYIIIDKEGKLVNTNANRPSGGVKEDLEALLK